MEIYYSVQIFKAPSCEVENQRINRNKRDMNKKSRRKYEERFNEEITKNMYEKVFIFMVLEHMYFSQVTTTYEYPLRKSSCPK